MAARLSVCCAISQGTSSIAGSARLLQPPDISCCVPVASRRSRYAQLLRPGRHQGCVDRSTADGCSSIQSGCLACHCSCCPNTDSVQCVGNCLERQSVSCYGSSSAWAFLLGSILLGPAVAPSGVGWKEKMQCTADCSALHFSADCSALHFLNIVCHP